MRYRVLAVLPIAWALAIGIAALASGRAMEDVLVAQNEIGKALALAGCATAALAFERGDYLRRAWSLSALCFLLLLIGDASGAHRIAAALSAHEIGAAQGACAILANASAVVGTWMLARAWSIAGFDDDENAAKSRRIRYAIAALVSLAITGWPIVHDVHELLAGQIDAVVSLASDFGDMISLALVAPLMQTALAMRGGLLRWPWGFLTASGVAWIAYDAASGVVDALNVAPGLGLVGSESLRALATGYMLVAGIAQRLTVSPDARASVLPAG